jgi:hypothetical protein
MKWLVELKHRLWDRRRGRPGPRRVALTRDERGLQFYPFIQL